MFGGFIFTGENLNGKNEKKEKKVIKMPKIRVKGHLMKVQGRKAKVRVRGHIRKVPYKR